MLTPISKRQYEKSNPIMRVVVHDNPRQFAALHLRDATHPLLLCWRSNMVEPVVSVSAKVPEVWVGIDQRLVCIAFDGRMLLSVALGSQLVDIKHFNDVTVALCETQALAFNTDHSLRCICDLREIPSNIEVIDHEFLVTFIDGNSEIVPI